MNISSNGTAPQTGAGLGRDKLVDGEKNGRFAGKVVLLASQHPLENAGLACRFAQLGTDVAIIYRSDLVDADQAADQMDTIRAQIEAIGQRCLLLPLGRDDSESPHRLIQQIIAVLGRLDFFISQPTFTQSETESRKLLPPLFKAALQLN